MRISAGQTATSSDAPSSAPRSITTSLSLTSVVGRVPVTTEARRRIADRLRRPSTSSRRSVRCRRVSTRRCPYSSTSRMPRAAATRNPRASTRSRGTGSPAKRTSARRAESRRRRPRRAQDARRLAHRGARIAHVLERLERADDVERGVRERERGDVHHAKRRARAAVALRRVGDRIGADVDADDAPRNLCEVRRPVTDAAGRVEHVRVCAELTREVVPLEVERDDAGSVSSGTMRSGWVTTGQRYPRADAAAPRPCGLGNAVSVSPAWSSRSRLARGGIRASSTTPSTSAGSCCSSSAAQPSSRRRDRPCRRHGRDGEEGCRRAR